MTQEWSEPTDLWTHLTEQHHHDVTGLTDADLEHWRQRHQEKLHKEGRPLNVPHTHDRNALCEAEHANLRTWLTYRCVRPVDHDGAHEDALGDTWEDEMGVGQIVESIPAMAAMAVELQRTHDQWAPGVHLNDLDFEAAALVAYQAMGKFPPKSMNELLLWVLGVLPEAEIHEDNDGQLVIYTGLRTGEPTPADGGFEASEALEKFL